jgi:lipopolysaccharide/colanic/teichoic acid biosynthesis glycosyltransferase
MDRSLGLVLALATLPIQAILAFAIIISMGRPVLFLQERAGLHGKPFTIYKFRTMLQDRRREQLAFAGTDRRKVHKTVDDPRITRVGRFLRKWSLDELPQLWNVVAGDMSLVGPRPELTSVIAEHYEPWQHRRHDVKPGMTGLWQISARGEDDLMYLCTEVDLEYVDSISLATDLRILAKTIPAAAGGSKGS